MRVRSLGVVIPLWGRSELTRLTLRRTAREAKKAKVRVRLVAVTDEGVNGDLASFWGYDVVRASNEPLSDKKNAGVLHLRGKVDGVVFLGSDDWATALKPPTFFDRYAAMLRKRAVCGPLDMWYVDLTRGHGLYSPGYSRGPRHGEPVGVGRAIRASLLDRLGWAPRPSGLARQHDAAMKKKLLSHGVNIANHGYRQEEEHVRIVDIKSPDSVTKFRKLLNKKRNRRCSWEEALAPFPKKEVAELSMLVMTATSKDGKNKRAAKRPRRPAPSSRRSSLSAYHKTGK